MSLIEDSSFNLQINTLLNETFHPKHPPLIQCPQCNNIPSLNIITRELIQIKCPCSFSHITTIKSFLTQYTQISTNKCEYNTLHQTRTSIEYCIQCQRRLCSECSHIHSSSPLLAKHITVKEVQPLSQTCKQHPTQHITAYCITCNEHLCSLCSFLHKNVHQTVQFDTLCDVSKLNTITSDIAAIKQKLNEHNTFLKNEIINELTQQIELINKVYEYNKNINDDIFKLVDVLIENYFFAKTNYFTISNIINNSNINIKHLYEPNENETLSESIDKLLTYFNETFIFEESKGIDLTNACYQVQSIHEHDGYINSLLVLPDDRVVSGSSGDNTIKVFSFQGIQYHCDISIKNSHKGGVNNLCYMNNVNTSPNEHIILSSGADNEIKVWKIFKHKMTLLNTINITENTNVIKIVPASNRSNPTCALATVACENGNVCVYNMKLNNELVKVLKIGNWNCSTVITVLFIKKKEMLVTCYDNDVLVMWEMKGFQVVSVFQEVECFAKNAIVDVETMGVVAVGGFGVLTIIDYETMTIVKKVDVVSHLNKMEITLYSFLVLDDGVSLLCGGDKGRMCVYDLHNGKFVFKKDYFVTGDVLVLARYCRRYFISASGYNSIVIWKY